MPRRTFLRGGAGIGALAALGAGGALTGCASDLTGSGTLPLPRPDNPVKWPVFAGNKPIAAGLPAETDATLNIYNWVAYINQDVVNSFASASSIESNVVTCTLHLNFLAKLLTTSWLMYATQL